jgi:broad-specificity NMP kinase
MFTEKKMSEKEREKIRENVTREILAEIKWKAMEEAMIAMLDDILREQEGDISGC